MVVSGITATVFPEEAEGSRCSTRSCVPKRTMGKGKDPGHPPASPSTFLSGTCPAD